MDIEGSESVTYIFMNHHILDKNFFNRNTIQTAQDLLGKYLIVQDRAVQHELIINEVEAYDGPNDKASHAYHGKTDRTKIMFEEGGTLYIYLVYGMHWMLNIVTGKRGYPAAILIRGAGQIKGPGRLSRFLGLNEELNGKLAIPKTGLWFEDRGLTIQKQNILATERIGIAYAGPIWAKKLYRFLIKKY